VNRKTEQIFTFVIISTKGQHDPKANQPSSTLSNNLDVKFKASNIT